MPQLDSFKGRTKIQPAKDVSTIHIVAVSQVCLRYAMGIRMKEKLTKNLGLKILSLFMAILFWIVILNVEDPVVTGEWNDIQVTKINENALGQKDKVYEVISGDTVDVTVKAKRSIIESLRSSDFQAIADLSELSIVNAVPIVVTIPKHGETVEISQNISTMKVSLENLKTEQFRIDVVTKGTVAEGYYVKDKTSSPNIIQVSGAETVINKIKEVVLEVNVSNKRESYEEETVPKVYDKNGSLMDSSKLTLNYEKVVVRVNMLQTKTVPLYIYVKGTPYDGYKYDKINFEPKQVVIAGEPEELDKVQYISGEYNIDNKKVDIEEEVNIADFIKNDDVILIDENQTAVINIYIKKLDTKDISYNGNEIELRNMPEGFTATLNIEDLVDVVAYGEAELLSSLSKYSLHPYIDLADAKTGTRNFQIQFSPPEEIHLSNPSVSVTLAKLSG